MKESCLSVRLEGGEGNLFNAFSAKLEREQPPLDEDSNRVLGVFKTIYGVWGTIGQTEVLSVQLLLDAQRTVAAGNPENTGLRGPKRQLSVRHKDNASFIPPPSDQIPSCLEALEPFLGDRPEPNPFLVKAALAHAQIELIQPFASENGTVARLMTLMVARERSTLSSPVLCPSVSFDRLGREYFESLNRVRNHGEWEDWLSFYADAVATSADHVFEAMVGTSKLIAADIEKASGLGRPADSATEVLQAMSEQPVATSNWLVAKTGLTPATVNKSLAHLGDLGVIRKTSNRRRNRIFCYTGLLEEICRDTGLEVPGTCRTGEFD